MEWCTSYKVHKLRFFCDGWNLFDFVLVSFAIMEVFLALLGPLSRSSSAEEMKQTLMEFAESGNPNSDKNLVNISAKTKICCPKSPKRCTWNVGWL